MLRSSILAVMLLSPDQLAIVIALCFVFCAFVALNVWLYFFLRNRSVRKLCTHQLQNKRNALLEQLAHLREGVLVDAEGEDDGDEGDEVDDDVDMLIVDEDDGDGDDGDGDDEKDEKGSAHKHYFGVIEHREELGTLDAEILYVEKMSIEARKKLGFADRQYDRKRFYVRYLSGFEAKLRSADDEVKRRYVDVMNEIASYKDVKVKGSYRQQRIFKGRKTLGMLLFSGKTLCIAFALNPADYEETRFRGIDKSSRNRFKKTPMLMRLTSSRRLEYAKYLLVQLAEANTVVLEENPKTLEFELETKTRDELYLDGKIKIVIMGEVPDSVPYEQPEELDAEELDADDDDEAAAVEENIRYNRSYTARIIQADDELKARYSEIKNHILEYNGVFNGITWRGEAFYAAKRDCFATFAIRGRTLCLFLAVDAKRFENTKYKVEDRTQQVRKARMPSMFRIKSDRGTKYAKELIDMVLAEKGVKARADYKPVNYRLSYRCTENLIRKGYIRVKTTIIPITEPTEAAQEEKQAKITAAAKLPSRKKRQIPPPKKNAEEKTVPSRKKKQAPSSISDN